MAAYRADLKASPTDELSQSAGALRVAAEAELEAEFEAKRRDHAELGRRLAVLENAKRRLEDEVENQRVEKAGVAVHSMEVENNVRRLQAEVSQQAYAIEELEATNALLRAEASRRYPTKGVQDRDRQRDLEIYKQLRQQAKAELAKSEKAEAARLAKLETEHQQVLLELELRRRESSERAGQIQQLENAEVEKRKRERTEHAIQLADMQADRRRYQDAARRDREQMALKLSQAEDARRILEAELHAQRKQKAKQAVKCSEAQHAKQRLEKSMQMAEQQQSIALEKQEARLSEMEAAFEQLLHESGRSLSPAGSYLEKYLSQRCCKGMRDELTECVMACIKDEEDLVEGINDDEDAATEANTDAEKVDAKSQGMDSAKDKEDSGIQVHVLCLHDAGNEPPEACKSRRAPLETRKVDRSNARPWLERILRRATLFCAAPCIPGRCPQGNLSSQGASGPARKRAYRDAWTSTQDGDALSALDSKETPSFASDHRDEGGAGEQPLTVRWPTAADLAELQAQLTDAEAVIREQRSQIEAWRQPPRYSKMGPACCLRVELPDRTLASAAESALRWVCAGSKCAPMRNAKVLQVRPIVNDILWQSYQTSREHMKVHHARVLARPVTPILPETPSAIQEAFPWLSQSLDAELNERLMFHGTTPALVEQIAQGGFDERLANLSGLYGAGVYFAEQSCKAFRYTGNNSVRCILLTRAVLGEPYFAARAMKSMRRPPPLNPQDPTQGLYDSVVAETNASTGAVASGNSTSAKTAAPDTPRGRSRSHPEGELPHIAQNYHRPRGLADSHRVFVLFEGRQAYPELAIYFTVEPSDGEQRSVDLKVERKFSKMCEGEQRMGVLVHA
mmetsp:Transcript_29063/g.52862  ORF Transcript_29063/g.52862 Transcript_29063/m.52862 type:complete len:853 (-) Transcript_29063:8-2566(-)